MTDRQMLIEMWDELWNDYTWIPAWSKSLSDLSPQQAAWKPGAGRNSIWQHLNHIAFWRETTLKKIANKPPTEAEVEKGNFEAPADPSPASWAAARERLKKSHDLIRTALADESIPVDKLRYLLPHDAYHLGQIMLLRGMQGIPAIAF